MTASDVAAVVLATVVAGVATATIVALVALSRTLRGLRAAIDELRAETLPMVDELREAVTATTYHVERVDRILTSAELIEDRVDAASRLAYRTIQSPIVKAMAIGAGVQRTAHRLAGREPAAPAAPEPSARRRRFGRKAG